MTPTLHRRSGRHDAPTSCTQTTAPFLGRLEFPTCHGPRSVIVECVPAGDGYTLHLPAFNEASNYLADAPVSLTAVAPDSDADARVTGRSRLVADDDVPARAVELLERWPDGPAAHYFHITPTTDPPIGPAISRPACPSGPPPEPQRRSARIAPSPHEQHRG